MNHTRSSFPSSPTERVLLVEGRHDKHVVEHFYWKRFEEKPPFVVEERDGYSHLCKALELDLKVPDRKVVGVIVDANDDLESRWRAVTDRVRREHPEIEFGDPVPRGCVVSGQPRIGIWLWPDNASSGELEDFVAEMIPCEDPVWPLSEGYIKSIPVEQRPFSKGKTGRARLHAWLAVRKEPRLMGAAIRAEELKVDGALATRFAKWLEVLFRDQA